MTAQKRKLAILGSTGSIGTQALEVVREQQDRFGDPGLREKVALALSAHPIKVYAGPEALEQVVQMDGIDMVLTALVGYAGLRPTLAAIRAGKHIALANKETLVVAGELVTSLAKEKSVNIYPVDSEHSAIFQCLAGEWHNPIEKIYLTASGGPFRGKNKDFLATVKKEQALKHPNWDMGAKITIDSATLMNKGLEVIEAKWLFGLAPEQIDVIVHPQSIIHSIVQFRDGSMKAQMGLPDMKLPIQYAIGYPERLSAGFPRFDFLKYPSLTFEPPDLNTFRNLAIAIHAMKSGGNAPCIINAANEVAVAAFLNDRIGFLEMTDLIEDCLQRVTFIGHPSLEDYIETDRETRRIAEERVPA
jgi:1-deoxy-D-xylulose-5-phosphate reductoisomerase